MRFALIACLAFAQALAGCSTASVSGHGGGSAATGASGGSVSVSVQGGSAAAVVLGVATMAALLGAWRNAPAQGAAPAMLEGRAISEVDCAQPIADWSKNLKCR